MSTCEIWQGDSTLLTEKIDGPIHAIITDPPYGMGFKSERAVTPEAERWSRHIENDDDLDKALATFFAAMIPLIPKCADDAEMYVFTRWSMIQTWVDAVNELSPFEVKNLLIWDKIELGMGDLLANWDYSYEVIIYAKKGRKLLNARRSSILTFRRVYGKSYVHPTQKPVELMEELIKISTKPGEFIVDPFCGSGASIIAAERLNRNAIGIELDAEHAARGQAKLGQNYLELGI